MKQLYKICALLLAVVCSAGLTSCLDDDDDNDHVIDWPTNPSALVTLKTENGEFFMQVDDSTRLIPAGIDKNPYGKEVRALVTLGSIYIDYPETWVPERYVNVVHMDTIRTKTMSEDLGTDNASTYGNAPIEILNSWTTVCEDGYLTLTFEAIFAGQKTHTLRLVKGSGDYDVVLYHDNAGETNGRRGDGLIAFRLDKLPDTEGKTVDLTLHWMSFRGEKTAKFKYRTRK